MKVELMGLAAPLTTTRRTSQSKDVRQPRIASSLRTMSARAAKVRPNGLPRRSLSKTLEQIGKALANWAVAAEHDQQIRLEVHGADATASAHQDDHGRGYAQERRRLLEFQPERPRRPGLRSQLQSREGQNLLRPHATSTWRGIVSPTLTRLTDRLQRLLSGGDPDSKDPCA